MGILLWMAAGAAVGWLMGRAGRGAMGPTGDVLLGLGGGVAGGAVFAGFGLGGLIFAPLAGAAGGAAMVAFVRAIRE